jgi:hypothetical protein
MLIRKLALSCAVLAAVSPVIANATSDRVSAKACAHAFASSIAASGASAPAFKLAYHDSVASALSAFYPTDYTFMLEAHDPKTGAAIARATCTTDFRGVVTSISVLPVGTNAASLASQF